MRTNNLTVAFTALAGAAAFTALFACSAPADENDPPPFSGPLNTGSGNTAGGAPTAPGTPAAPGATPSGANGSRNEMTVTAGLNPTPATGAAPTGAAPMGAAAGAPATPTPPGAGMLDVTIEAETFNQTTSKNVSFQVGDPSVGGMEVGSALCFDNVDLTGVESIDVLFSRDQSAVSTFGRFAILFGGSDVKTAMNLGEKLTTDSGGWTTFKNLNVGLATQVSGVGQLCFRGLQGNGILNIDNFTLRAAAGTNDGVTNFNIPVPTGPQVPRPQVMGNQVQFGGPNTSVAGTSMFWSNGPNSNDTFYTADTIKALKDTFGARVVRAALAVNDQDASKKIGGYLEDAFDNQFKVQTVVNAAIANGMYAIIDFHAHHAEDVQGQAVQFFGDMAKFYGGFNNVIYEIYNEPLTNWDTIKRYAAPVIQAIRAVDQDNLIIVGTPTFSQDVDQAAASPINDPNIAYTLHFYAGTHGADLRNKAMTAMAGANGRPGIALFVTEWGTTTADGLGNVSAGPTNDWVTFLEQNNISNCNWALADQLQVGASALVRGVNPSGPWTDAQLSASGKLAQGIIKGWPRAPGLP